jgi:transposase
MKRRHELTEEAWQKIEPLLPQRTTRRGRPGLSDREMVNAMLYRAKTGTPWRDLPERYGNWKTVYSRWLRWRDAGVWQRIWEALQAQANDQGMVAWEIHFIDSTVVRAHQHAAGAKKAARRQNNSDEAEAG